MPNPDQIPSNHQAEIAVLGAVLANNDTFRRVTDILPDPAYFSTKLHQQIWEVIQGQIASNEAADPITCAEYFEAVEAVEGVTAFDYLRHLAAHGTGRNVVDHAKAVRSAYQRRLLVAFADKARAAAMDLKPGEKIDGVFNDLESEFEALKPRNVESSGFVGFNVAADEAWEKAETAYKNDGRLIGHSTGLPALDDALAGLQPTDLIILAARTSMGKTAMATTIAMSVAQTLKDRKEPGVVAFTSLEMSREQLAQRIICDLAQVPSFKIRRGLATEAEMVRFIDARNSFKDLPLWIDHTGGLTITALKMRARAIKKRHGLAMLVVDYLQLLSGSAKGAKRYEEVTEISSGLKNLAKELEVPIIALSQLSRNVEDRPDNRPQMRDLRESSSIENDADTILMIYREEYYLKKNEPQKGTERYMEWERDMRRAAGVATVFIPKNRHGPETTVTLGFEGQFMKFTNSPGDREPEPASAPEREKREKKTKPWNPPPKALGILQVLRSMTLAIGKEIDGLPKGLKGVPYITFREECAKDQLEPGADEKKAVKLMEDNLPGLRQPPDQSQGFLDRATVGDVPYIFLTARGLKV